jgi:hypothetical protein
MLTTVSKTGCSLMSLPISKNLYIFVGRSRRFMIDYMAKNIAEVKDIPRFVNPRNRRKNMSLSPQLGQRNCIH